MNKDNSKVKALNKLEKNSVQLPTGCFSTITAIVFTGEFCYRKSNVASDCKSEES